MQQHDLRFIVKKLQPHLLVSGSHEVAAFRRFAARTVAKAGNPLPPWRLLQLADELTNYFHDPHTVVFPYATGLTMIPLGFHWVQGGIAAYPLADSPPGVQTGDSVVSLGGLAPRTLEHRLTRFFSGNAYWLRYFAGQQLAYGYLLHWLGLVPADGRVAVVLRQPDGTLLRLDLPLQAVTYQSGIGADLASVQFMDRYRAPLGLSFPLASNWSWEVTPRYGIFWLTACVNSAAYNAAVNQFFDKVAREQAPVVLLDLQGNGGGYSSVVFAWLHHLPKTRSLDQVLGDTSPHPQQPPIFRGQLFVLQSWSTFSAAVVIDDLLTSTGHAVRVGQPTGWSTGGWAAVTNYKTPLLKIPFQVATQNFPATYGRLPSTLRPQIPLALTLQDVRTGTNPIDRWLRSLSGASIH